MNKTPIISITKADLKNWVDRRNELQHQLARLEIELSILKAKIAAVASLEDAERSGLQTRLTQAERTLPEPEEKSGA